MATLAKPKIGLLGGSFNPAHLGHVHISIEALKRLKLDEIWWLISPQNPLKSIKETAPLAKRLAGAQDILKPYKNIIPTTLETQFNTQYTIDTIKALQQHFHRTQFIWLMGADNLVQFHLWDDWQNIMQRVPIAVMDRAPYGSKAMRSKAAMYFKEHQVQHPALLVQSTPPAWSYIAIERNNMSSTKIRAKNQK